MPKYEEHLKTVKLLDKFTPKPKTIIEMSQAMTDQFKMLAAIKGLNKTKYIEILICKELLEEGIDMKKFIPPWLEENLLSLGRKI